jgi:hypothetical protein
MISIFEVGIDSFSKIERYNCHILIASTCSQKNNNDGWMEEAWSRLFNAHLLTSFNFKFAQSSSLKMLYIFRTLATSQD